ncbi:hypothetical protein Tco_1338558 [Tanacetum coccineum]
MDEEVRESYRRLESHLFHEGRFVTPSFIEVNNMLPTFQVVGLESFLTLDEPICPRFIVEFYHSLEVKRDEEERPYIEFKLGQFTFELDSSQLSRIFQTLKVLETFYTNKWSLDSLDDHSNSRFFSPKHDLVKKNITIPRTTQTQVQRDPNKLHIDDIRPELRGWELFFRENFFCTVGNGDHVNALKNKRNGPMPFAMLLTRLYKHILQTNPQAIVPLARFTFHERVMNPLDISRNPTKEKGKRVASPSASSSSSSSSDDNESPSFLEFYEKLSDNENLTDAQREKRGMFKCLNRYFGTITKLTSGHVFGCHGSTDPPYDRSICGLDTYYTSSSSPSESSTPTHVAPPPKFCLVIPLKLEPQELPPLASSQNDPYVSTMDNWQPGPSKPSPPPRVTQPPPGFPHPPPEFKALPSTQPLFVNINNNTPHLHNNAPPIENIHHPPPNLGNQDFPNPLNILDFVHPNDMHDLYNMFCQCCSTTRHEIQMLQNCVNYMFSYIRHHLGSSSNPPYFLH